MFKIKAQPSVSNKGKSVVKPVSYGIIPVEDMKDITGINIEYSLII